MRTLALVVEYDGSGYRGFARQTGAPSIAQELETALSILLGHSVRLVAAGRTDAGVHATGQVVSFTTDSDFPIERLPIAVSALLRERSIAVVRAVTRAAGFSARFDALARSYHYRILNRVAPSPLERSRVFHVGAPLDVESMRMAAEALRGTHDFAALSAADPAVEKTIRTVSHIDVARSGDFVQLDVTADSFLHHMVRVLTGTLIEVGRHRRSARSIPAVLASGRREQAGFTAPPHGLYLTHVTYADPL
ncbi:MAG: tRNA pseudouridine(38-40) synthase TruA [Candidatus Eremiobacteraeota bacterium]|nr:tRNA pseudouridine(38-40) synthase TruA [Candidatus Eremiobacteraeota bacterium]